MHFLLVRGSSEYCWGNTSATKKVAGNIAGNTAMTLRRHRGDCDVATDVAGDIAGDIAGNVAGLRRCWRVSGDVAGDGAVFPAMLPATEIFSHAAHLTRVVELLAKISTAELNFCINNLSKT